MISARPGINGNTAKDFQAVVDKFTDAMKAVGEARKLLATDVLNGRNYQHLPHSEAVDRSVADRSTYAEAMIAILEQLDTIRTDIHNAMQGDRT
jgi:hypothetical protein